MSGPGSLRNRLKYAITEAPHINHHCSAATRGVEVIDTLGDKTASRNTESLPTGGEFVGWCEEGLHKESCVIATAAVSQKKNFLRTKKDQRFRQVSWPIAHGRVTIQHVRKSESLKLVLNTFGMRRKRKIREQIL